MTFSTSSYLVIDFYLCYCFHKRVRQNCSFIKPWIELEAKKAFLNLCHILLKYERFLLKILLKRDFTDVSEFKILLFNIS
jgi:hypothetical protein